MALGGRYRQTVPALDPPFVGEAVWVESRLLGLDSGWLPVTPYVEYTDTSHTAAVKLKDNEFAFEHSSTVTGRYINGNEFSNGYWRDRKS